MIDPVVFHIAWFFVGLAMMGIPIVLSEKLQSKINYTTKMQKSKVKI